MATRTLLAPGAAALVIALATPALAAWVVPGAGTGTVRAGALPSGPAPTSPTTATQRPGSVTVAWPAVSYAGTSTPVPGYVVQRFRNGVAEAVGGSCGGVVTTTSCTDAVTTAGATTYAVTPAAGAWRGPQGPRSATVTVITPAGLTVTSAGPAVAGAPLSLTVTAVMSDGSTDTTWTGSRTLTVSGAATALSGDAPTTTATVSATAGVATVPVTLVRAETVPALTLTDAAAPTRTGATAVTVSAATTTRLAWSGLGGAGTPGAPCLFTCTVSAIGVNKSVTGTVVATDAYGNPGAAVSRTVTLTATAGAVTPASSTSTAPVSWTYTSPNGSGSATGTVTAASAGLTSAVLTASR